MVKKIFVYGTLKKGLSNHRFLTGCRFVSSALLRGHAMYHLGSYPGVIPSFHDKDVVHGEVYEVDEFSLKAIDRLESNGFLYIRREVEVEIDGAFIEVETYIYKQVVNSDWQIKDGIFRGGYRDE